MKKRKTKTQQERITNFLRKNGRITAKQALSKFGTKNLRARINDLRKAGLQIETVPNRKNKRSVVYSMPKTSNT